MSKIKNKADPFVRAALFKAYKGKCFYCSEIIRFNNFEIDHVIPKNIDKEEAIKKYSLSNFEFDSYNNLVPTCFPCNNKKRATEYSIPRIISIFEIIEPKIPEIENLEEKYRKDPIESEILKSIQIAKEKGASIPEILTIIKPNTETEYQKQIIEKAIAQLNPITTYNDYKNKQLQIFVEEINKLSDQFWQLDSFFQIQKNIYANRKIGIIIYKGNSNNPDYSLFPAPEGNINLLRELNQNDWMILSARGIVSGKKTDLSASIIKAPLEVARQTILNYYSELISYNIVYRSNNFFLINEFIIDFIDKFHIQLGLDKKEKYTTNELFFAYYSFLPIWVDEILLTIDEETITRLLKDNGYVDLSFLDFFDMSKIKQIVYQRIKDKKLSLTGRESIAVGSEKFLIALFPIYLKYLNDNKIKKVHRIYKPKNYSLVEGRKGFFTADLYSDDDVKYNLKIIFDNFQEIFKDSIKKVVPKLEDDIKVYEKIIIELKESQNPSYGRKFSLVKYYLENNDGNELQIIYNPGKITEIPEEARLKQTEKLFYNNKEYDYWVSHGVLDFIYEPLPMHKLLMEFLDHLIGELLMKNIDIVLKNLI